MLQREMNQNGEKVGSPLTSNRAPDKMSIQSSKVFEFRKEQRLRLKSGAFAISDATTPEAGQILDISMGGLAFLYMDQGACSRGIFNLELLLDDNCVHLEDVQARIISDFEISNEGPSSFIKMRRCGVQFLDLSRSQLKLLESFISQTVDGDNGKKHAFHEVS